MVSINKNKFMNQDNGLSLSNSKKNTDELFAELFSILHSSDNLNNMDKDKLVKYEKILNQDTTDIFDIIVKSKSVPQDLDKDLIKNIQNYSHKIDFSKLKEKLPN